MYSLKSLSVDAIPLALEKAERYRLLNQPWAVFYPGMAIFLISLSFNFMGDALRDAADTQSR